MKLMLAIWILLIITTPLTDIFAQAPKPVRVYETAEVWAGPPAEILPKDAISEDVAGHSFDRTPVLCNGRIRVAPAEGGIYIFSSGPEGGFTLRARAELRGRKGTEGSELISAEIGYADDGELLYRRDRAMLNVIYRGKEEEIGVQIALGRDALVFELTPKPGLGAVRVHSDLHYLVIPAFVGDDLLFDPSRYDAGKAFLPAENILLAFAGEGNALVQTVWPIDGQQHVTAQVVDGEKGRIVEYVEIKPDGKPLFLAAWEQEGLWREVEVGEAFWDEEDEPAEVDIGPPPFEAKWQAIFHGDRDTSWEVMRAGHRVAIGFHGGGADYYHWALRNIRGRLTLLHPPEEVQNGRAERVLIYPLERASGTPRSLPTPEDILRQALGDGPCEYLLARDAAGEKSAPGGPICQLCARMNILRRPFVQVHRHSDFMLNLVDWTVKEGKWQYSRAENYLQFGHFVSDNLQMMLRENPDLDDQYGEIEGWAEELVEHCEHMLDAVRPRRCKWSDFRPESDDPIEALDELAERLRESLLRPPHPELEAEWRDLIGKLNQLAQAPQFQLPRARRLTRMIQNEATRLASLGKVQASFAADVRFRARETLQGRHWAEYER